MLTVRRNERLEGDEHEEMAERRRGVATVFTIKFRRRVLCDEGVTDAHSSDGIGFGGLP